MLSELDACGVFVFDSCIQWNGSVRHSSDLSTYFTMRLGHRIWRLR